MRDLPGQGLYEDAYVYDVLHERGTAAEVTGLQRVVARLGAAGRLGSGAGPGGRGRAAAPLWLEPACGSGRYLRVAARRGIRVIGFDREPGMVDYARGSLEKLGLAGRATLFVADMTRFADRVGPARVDFAFNLFNTIRHLASDRELAAHFGEMARVLKPGGLYAVGLSLTPYGLDPPAEDVWHAVRGRLRVEQVIQFVPPGAAGSRSEAVYSHLTITRGAVSETRSSHYRLRCYDAAQWAAAVRRSPFEAVDCVDEHGRSIGALAWPYGIQVLRRK